MKVFKACKNTLKQIDIFGVNLSFKYNKIDNFKTLFGSIFTLILGSLFLYKFILSVKELILKENLDFSREQIPIEQDIIELQNLQLALCPLYGAVFGDTRFENFMNFTYYSTNDTQDAHHEPIPLQKSNCKGSIYLLNNIRNLSDICFCPKFDNTTKIQKVKELFEDKTVLIRMTLNYSFLKQNNTQEYLINKKDPRSVKQFLLIYTKYYVNVTDYSNTIRNKTEFIYDSFNMGANSDIQMLADKLEVNKINDIYTFGLVYPQVDSDSSFSFYKGTVNVENNIYPDDNHPDGLFSSVQILLKHSGIVIKYNITSFNLETFLSKFGGFFQIFFILFSLISSCVNENSLEYYIERRFMYNMKNIESVIEEIENLAANNNKNQIIYKNIYFNESKGSVDSDFKIPEENKLEKEDVPCTGKIITSTKIEKSSTDKNYISVKNLKEIYSVNGNSDNSSNSARINNSINSDNVDNNFKIEMNNFQPHFNQISKKNLIRKINDVHYSKQLINDFISILDYEEYYNLVKEIKLMKFFLFNLEDLKWIHKFQKVPFSIENFENFIKENGQEYSNKNNFNLDLDNSFNIKLQMLKDFLLRHNFEIIS